MTEATLSLFADTDDVAYLLRLCEAAGDDPVQMRGSRLAAILRRLLELEEPS